MTTDSPGGYVGWLRSQVGSTLVQLNFAAACVVDEDNRLLLQLRSDSNQWGLPGGAIELGESAADAARREVLEETGLHIEISDLLGVYTKYEQAYPTGDKAQPITVAFCCHAVGEAVEGHDDPETVRTAWFGLDAMPSLWSELHSDAVVDLAAGRRGVFR